MLVFKPASLSKSSHTHLLHLSHPLGRVEGKEMNPLFCPFLSSTLPHPKPLVSPSLTTTRPSSSPYPPFLHISAIRNVEDKLHSTFYATPTTSQFPEIPTTVITAKKRPVPSLLVTIFNGLDDFINNFIGPPLPPSIDPKHVLSGNFAPVDELPPTECEVIEGSLPPCLDGAYIRNGPNPQFYPRGPHHLFDGDGMLHSIRISHGRPIFCSRYVKTYKYIIEKRAGSPFDPVNGVGLANTSVAFFCGHLYALAESDLPYAVRLTPDGDIKTLGRYDFDGKLSMSMTAHPKIDPSTGEAFAFRYSPVRPFLTYFRFDAQGKKQPDVPIFSLSCPSFFHDFAITNRYAIFPDIQMWMNPVKMIIRGGSPVGTDPTKVPRKVRIDLKTGTVTRHRLSQWNLEFAVINPGYLGKKNRYVYSAVGDPLPKISGIVKLDVSRSDRRQEFSARRVSSHRPGSSQVKFASLKRIQPNKMDAFSSSFLSSTFTFPSLTTRPPIAPSSLPQIPSLNISAVRIEEKQPQSLTAETSSQSSKTQVHKPPPPPPRRAALPTRNIPKKGAAEPSLPVTIFNALDDVINNFIDPPLRSSVDPRYVLSQNFAPVEELPPTECEVTDGSLPPWLDGAYIRNGPNPQFLPRGPYHLFDGDGMLHSIRISQGRAILCSRYVKTYKYTIERRAGSPILPNFNPTLGRHDFDGKLVMSMTAHPKVDPETGEAFAFRYGPVPPFLTYFRFDAQGRKQPDVPIFSLTSPSFLHDFGITKKYAIFADIQIGMNPVEMVTGGSPRLDMIHASVEMVRIDLKTGMVTRHPLSTRNLDFAVINPGYVGKKNKYVYAAVGNPMPKISGVVKLDVEPDNPEAEEDDGYIVSYVHDEKSGESKFLVMDAKTPNLDIVAAVRLPRRVPYGFHGLLYSKKDALLFRHR
ncbi:unnamed protein product, partial [Vitis vinifera]